MAVNIIKTTGSGNTVPDHQRSDKSSQSGTLADIDTGSLIVPRFIYSKLSSLTDAKNLSKAKVMLEANEYDFFMMEMETLNATGEDFNGISAIDEYLGGLGVIEEYPFLKDVYNVEPWVTTLTQVEFRNVANTYTYIDNEVEVVVVDNIVAEIDGITYNVIHNTLL